MSAAQNAVPQTTVRSSGVLRAAGGHLDLLKAFTWGIEDIKTYLKQASEAPADYIDPVHTFTAPTTFRTAIATILQRINDKVVYALPGAAPPGPLVTPYCEIPLNAFTIFDLLGWVFSITAWPQALPSEVNESNFYVPHLAVFARWCGIIANICTKDVSGDKVKIPVMASIAYFQIPVHAGIRGVPIKDGQVYVMVGATIGAALVRESVIRADRRQNLDSLQFHGPLDANGQIVANYGSCSETNFYLFVKRVMAKGNPGFLSTASGVSLKPFDIAHLRQYEPDEVRKALQDPCKQSCQQLFMQIEPPSSSWNPKFSKDGINKRMETQFLPNSNPLGDPRPKPPRQPPNTAAGTQGGPPPPGSGGSGGRGGGRGPGTPGGGTGGGNVGGGSGNVTTSQSQSTPIGTPAAATNRGSTLGAVALGMGASAVTNYIANNPGQALVHGLKAASSIANAMPAKKA